MEYLFEFILDLILEGSIAILDGSIKAEKCRKVAKYIRYPLIIMIALLFIAVIGLIFLAGILSLKKNIPAGILFILLGLWMLIMGVIKFRKVYFIKVKK